MTNTNPRDLIKQLADELDHYRQLLMGDGRETHELATEARAALAQPEPEGPTDEEILALSQEHGVSYTMRNGGVIYGKQEGNDVRDDVLSFARAVLARWDRTALKPVPVSERPWEREGWCDGNGWCWWFDADDPGWVFDQPQFSIWTHCLPAHALPLPVPTQHGCTERR